MKQNTSGETRAWYFPLGVMSFQAKIPFVARFYMFYIGIWCTTIPKYCVIWHSPSGDARNRKRTSFLFCFSVFGADYSAYLPSIHLRNVPFMFLNLDDPRYMQFMMIFCKKHLCLSAFNVPEFHRNRIMRLYDLTDFVRWQLWHVFYFALGVQGMWWIHHGWWTRLGITDWLSLY